MRRWLLIGLLLAGTPVLAEVGPAPADPFAGFETHYLRNGVRIWYKHLPADSKVSFGVIVPYGADADPDGKEQLAHFTEHMLFSDHLGRTEEEIKREIEDRGGRRNGVTRADHTYYWVTIDKQHGMLALDWIYGIVSPHEMEPEVVTRGREPVVIEGSIRPRQLHDYVSDYYFFPLPLRLPSFWKREFGLRSRADRAFDPYGSVYSITPEDLREFYDTYYVPSRMTLVAVGDLEREAVLEAAEATFGTLPSRSTPRTVYPPLRDPGQANRFVFWDFRANVMSQMRFKVYDPTAEDHLDLWFIRHFLRRRLGSRLRYGERKAVYGVSASVISRGPAMFLDISARIKPSELDFANSVLEEELEMLRSGTHPAEEFETVRKAIVATVAGDYQRAHELIMLATRVFYDRDLYEDYPDMVSHFRNLTQLGLAEAARRLLDEDRTAQVLIRPQPLSQGALGVIAGLAIVIVLRGVARYSIQPIRMRTIRYVARFYRPVLYRLIFLPLWILGIAVVLRLGFFAIERLAIRFIVPVDNYALQWSFFGVSLAAGFLVLVLWWGAVPVKLLVFDDHVRVKYRGFRSRLIPFSAIASISLKRFADLRREGKLLRTRPLGFGVLEPAVHLELESGRGYLFHVRRNQELVSVIRELQAQRRQQPS